jgi:hypothetical protein
MRPQTIKANMRDTLRRLDKRTHGVLREKSRQKRSNKKRRRQGIRATTPNKETFTEHQLGEREGKVGRPEFEAVTSTAVALERDALKEENERMQNYIQFLLWRVNDQERKGNQQMVTLVKVHKGQARYIRRVDTKLKLSQSKLKDAQDELDELTRHFLQGGEKEKSPTLDDMKELAGVAC